MKIDKAYATKNFKSYLNILKNSIKTTLGPTGKNAIIDNKQELKLVDDGITILKELDFKGKKENSLLQLVRQASLRTNEIAGDGTTTTALISCVLLEEAINLNLAGIKSIHLSVGLKKLLHFLIQKIRQLSQPLKTLDEIEAVLKTSMGSIPYELIKNLAQLYVKKSKDSILVIEEKQFVSEVDKVDITEGIYLEQGFASPYFLKDLSKPILELTKPNILISEVGIENIEQIREVLGYIKSNNQPLIIISTSFSRAVLSTLIINNLNDNLKVVAIKAPYFGLKRKMILEDLGFITSSNFIDEKIYEKNYKFKIEDLGKIKKATISKQETNLILLNSSTLSLSKRINQLQRDLNINDSIYEKDIISYRISLLSGGIAKFYISATTDTELSNMKYKLEDGINSLKTSFQEGISISSNSLYVHLIELAFNWSLVNLSNDELYSFYLLKKALLLPFCQICENVNVGYSCLLNEVLEKGYPFGVDFKKIYVCDLKKEKIFDSSKMIRVILQNSFSVSTALMSTF